MGNGIAHVFAQSGHSVTLVDVQAGALERALGTIARNLDRILAKGGMAPEEREATLGRIATTTDLAGGVAGGAAMGAVFGAAALSFIPVLGVIAVMSGVATGAVAGTAGGRRRASRRDHPNPARLGAGRGAARRVVARTTRCACRTDGGSTCAGGCARGRAESASRQPRALARRRRGTRRRPARLSAAEPGRARPRCYDPATPLPDRAT